MASSVGTGHPATNSPKLRRRRAEDTPILATAPRRCPKMPTGRRKQGWQEGRAACALGIHGDVRRKIRGAKMKVPVVERAGGVVRLINQDSHGDCRRNKVEAREAHREAQLQRSKLDFH